MEWVVNYEDDITKNILFTLGERRWEIAVDLDKDDDEISLLVLKRKKELEKEFEKWNSFDFSDLFVDWRENII